jgi:NADH-quinone oxidoreductase subunit G
VLLVGFEPEEESPIVFLRLRKAVRTKGLQVHSVAPFASRGLEKLSGRLLATAPGAEAAVLDAIRSRDKDVAEAAQALHAGGAVILVGERLASTPGALTAVTRLAAATDARLAWVPRRAGERGAVEAGALPSLLPGGRPVAQADARVDVATAWGVDSLPSDTGRGLSDLLAAVHTADVRALVIGGVDPHDLPDPTAALAAIDAAEFVVSLELRASAVTTRADVVLPVAPAVEKAGTFLDWEGRARPFAEVLRGTNALSDTRVLHVLAAAMDVDLGLPDVAAARAELAELGPWDGERAPGPDARPAAAPRPGAAEAVLATWHLLLDAGRLQDDEPFLAGTAHRPVARLGPATAAALGLDDDDPLKVSTDAGSITLPLVVTPDMAEGVVWLPTNSVGSALRSTLRADNGAVVRISAGGAG